MIYSLKRDSFFLFFFLFFFYFFNNKTVITSYNCLFYVLLLVSRVLWRLYNYSVPKISFCLKLKGSFKYSNNISDAISSRFIKPRRGIIVKLYNFPISLYFLRTIHLEIRQLFFFIPKLTKESWEACAGVWICK